MGDRPADIEHEDRLVGADRSRLSGRRWRSLRDRSPGPGLRGAVALEDAGGDGVIEAAADVDEERDSIEREHAYVSDSVLLDAVS